jgi:hypothetical protein
MNLPLLVYALTFVVVVLVGVIIHIYLREPNKGTNCDMIFLACPF